MPEHPFTGGNFMSVTPRNTFEAQAQAWHDAGRPEAKLEKNDWPLLGMYLRRMYLVTSDTFDAFTEASVAAKGQGWYQTMLRKRDHCHGCYESYRIENLAVCIYCRETYCYRCESRLRREGNLRLCGCGGVVLG